MRSAVKFRLYQSNAWRLRAYRLARERPVLPPFMSDRQPFASISTPNLRAAVRIRRHAASRSLSLTPSTWSKRATALRTCRASFSGSLRSFGKAKVVVRIRFLCWVLIPAERFGLRRPWALRAAAFWRVVAMAIPPWRDSSSIKKRFRGMAHPAKKRAGPRWTWPCRSPEEGQGDRLGRRCLRAWLRARRRIAAATAAGQRRSHGRVVRGRRRGRARAEPVPLGEAEEKQDQHKQSEDRSRDARPCARARVGHLDDLTARRAPVPTDAVPACSQ